MGDPRTGASRRDGSVNPVANVIISGGAATACRKHSNWTRALAHGRFTSSPVGNTELLHSRTTATKN